MTDDGATGQAETTAHRAFEDFYVATYRPVLTLVRALTTDIERARDITQDAFAEALDTWNTIHDPAAWVRRVAINKAHSAMRRRYAERRAIQRIAPPGPIEYDLPHDTAEFWAAVRSLPKRQAQAIALFYVEDRSTADIANLLGCSESTARVHLSRGRRRLARLLEGSR